MRWLGAQAQLLCPATGAAVANCLALALSTTLSTLAQVMLGRKNWGVWSESWLSKMLAAKADNLSSIPGTHVKVEE